MINYNKLAFYDFETSSVDPYTADPVQLACVIYDPRTLRPVTGGEFVSKMKPPTLEDKDGNICPKYVEEHLSTIQWHCKLRKISQDELLAEWKTAPPEKVVWEQFVNFLKKYNSNQKRFSKLEAPIPAGWNILKYDNIITQRLCEKYGNVGKDGEQNIFCPKFGGGIDGLTMMFLWFENLGDGPDSYSLDTLRDYFGMSAEGAHDALVDTKQVAQIITRFMSYHRVNAKYPNTKNEDGQEIVGKSKFKGAFANV